MNWYSMLTYLEQWKKDLEHIYIHRRLEDIDALSERMNLTYEQILRRVGELERADYESSRTS